MQPLLVFICVFCSCHCPSLIDASGQCLHFPQPSSPHSRHSFLPFTSLIHVYCFICCPNHDIWLLIKILLFSRRDHFSIMMQNLCNVIIGSWDCKSADQEDLWKRHEIINSQSHLLVLACSHEKKMQMVLKEYVGDGG